MGIPSYYKKLVNNVQGLISKSVPSEDIDWLWMDFNCLIYHCLHRDDLRPYPGDSEKEQWEQELIENIVKYTKKVIAKVGAKQGVRICIDGVVPMAKMRQQRLRRFKSVWLSKHQLNNGNGGLKEEGVNPLWDTNAITPGTNFMRKLRVRLEKLSNNLHISSSDEPGEGEHKIMSDWRTGNYKGNFAIYGLDADLLVLTLLNREICELNNNIYMFREEINNGQIQRDSLGEEEFEWFSVNVLRNYICSRIEDTSKHRSFIINYSCAMSILGNDFLPSSLGLKIRDDGHSELLDILDKMIEKNINIINSDLSISLHGLFSLFNLLSVQESDRISFYIYKKIKQAKNLGVIDEKETSIIEIDIGDNNWPLGHIEESCLRSNKKGLINNWEDIYITKWFSNDKNKICEEYLYTIQWIWNYYTGKMENVCYNWYYSHRLPPLWKWLSNYLEKDGLCEFPKSIRIEAKDITPLEQLCIVLPLESWHLIPDCKQKELPLLAPQYFPSNFTFDSVGKRFFWECEAEIPLISICEIKALFS